MVLGGISGLISVVPWQTNKIFFIDLSSRRERPVCRSFSKYVERHAGRSLHLVLLSHALRYIATHKGPPCLKGAVSVADWGIYPSTANAVPLPLGEGGFLPVRLISLAGVDVGIGPYIFLGVWHRNCVMARKASLE